MVSVVPDLFYCRCMDAHCSAVQVHVEVHIKKSADDSQSASLHLISVEANAR